MVYLSLILTASVQTSISTLFRTEKRRQVWRGLSGTLHNRRTGRQDTGIVIPARKKIRVVTVWLAWLPCCDPHQLFTTWWWEMPPKNWCPGDRASCVLTKVYQTPAQLVYFCGTGHEQWIIMDFACGVSWYIYSLLTGIYHFIDFSFPLERFFMGNSYIFIYIFCS